MKKLLRESLLEKEDQLEPKRSVDIENEMSYFSDLEDSFKDDPEYAKSYYAAIEEFGVPKKDLAIIGSYGADSPWDAIKNELDRLQIEYYEFDDIQGESAILFNVNDLQSYKNDQDFKRSWGGGTSF